TPTFKFWDTGDKNKPAELFNAALPNPIETQSPININHAKCNLSLFILAISKIYNIYLLSIFIYFNLSNNIFCIIIICLNYLLFILDYTYIIEFSNCYSV